MVRRRESPSSAPCRDGARAREPRDESAPEIPRRPFPAPARLPGDGDARRRDCGLTSGARELPRRIPYLRKWGSRRHAASLGEVDDSGFGPHLPTRGSALPFEFLLLALLPRRDDDRIDPVPGTRRCPLVANRPKTGWRDDQDGGEARAPARRALADGEDFITHMLRLGLMMNRPAVRTG